MNLNVPEWKAELRRQARARSREQTPEQHAAASHQLCLRFKEQKIWGEARGILFYLPLPDEPDIRPLLAEALAAGRGAALPRYLATEDRYEVCAVQDLDQLQAARFGVLEPPGNCPLFDLKRLDMALVPGIAFAFDGARLGRGKGYYDRLLAQVTGWKCGVAFDWQVIPEIPTEAHDIRLNCILTPTLRQDVAGRARY